MSIGIKMRSITHFFGKVCCRFREGAESSATRLRLRLRWLDISWPANLISESGAI